MEKMLWRRVAEGGISQEECSILYLLGDERPEGAHGQTSKAQLTRCLPKFREAIAPLNPQCIIVMGGEAFRAVTGLTYSIDDARAYVIHPWDVRQVPERRQVQIGEYKRPNQAKGIKAGDPKMAARLIPVSPPLPDAWTAEGDAGQTHSGNEHFIVPCVTVEYLVMNRLRPMTAFLAAIQVAKEYGDGEPLIDEAFRWSDGIPEGVDFASAVAFDLETDMSGKVIERGSLAVTGSTTSFRWDDSAQAVMRFALDIANLRIAHNIQFDEPILRAHGIPVPEPWFDTMVAAQLLEPDLPKGLGRVAPLFMRTKPWKHYAEERGFADPEYSAKDSFMELMLYKAQREELERQGMLDLFENRIMPSIKVLIDLKEKGIRLDPHEVGRWCLELQEKREYLLHKWYGHFPDVNPFSTKDVQTLLYQTWKLPVQRTKHDGVTADELALKQLMAIAPDRVEPLFLLLALREVDKNLSTYAKTALGQEYVHPSYLPMGKDTEGPYGKGGARSGRLSSSGPNIQNQPKVARAMYITDDPLNVFVAFDRSQAELRIGAVRSGDTALAKALEGDVHAYTMSVIGCDRTRAKNVIYGSAYGAGPKKLRETLLKEGITMSEAECKALQQALARTYPVWWRWRWSVGDLATSQGFLRNSFGRVVRFPMRESDVPAALNFFPQSDCADIEWSLFRPAWELAREFGGRLTTLVHDEYLFQVGYTKVAEFVPAMKALLERPFDEIAPGFRIPVTVKVGAKNWRDMEEYNAVPQESA